MIKKIGVIGAGQMGNGIAHVAALAGFDITLLDIDPERLDAARTAITGNLDRQVRRTIVSGEDRDAALGLSTAERTPPTTESRAIKSPPSTID